MFGLFLFASEFAWGVECLESVSDGGAGWIGHGEDGGRGDEAEFDERVVRSD